MNKKFMKGFMISSKICQTYEEISVISLTDNEDSDEYFEIIDKLKFLIIEEDKTYSLLNLEDIKQYLYEINLNDLDNCYIERYYSKLNYRKKILTGEEMAISGFLLGSIVNSKILIDMMKKTDNSIEEMEVFNSEEEDFLEDLKLYHNTSKYTFFSENEFIEKIGLLYNFDIKQIPNLTFEAIQKIYQVDLIDISQNALLYSVFNLIDSLICDNKKCTIPNVYFALSTTSHLEVMISLMNKDSLIKVIKYYNSRYKDSKCNKVYLRSIKDAILRKKEEFNK